MDTHDAQRLITDTQHDLIMAKKRLLTAARAAYGHDSQERHDAAYEIEEAFTNLHKTATEMKEALTARWRKAGNDTRGVYDEIKAEYPDLLYQWASELPHMNPLDRADLLYLLTSTIADIVIHYSDPNHPDVVAQIADLRAWVQRLEAIDAKYK